MMLMHDDAHDDACCMMMRDSLSLQGVSIKQDYDVQNDAAEHTQRGCPVTPFCDWKSLSSVLRVNLLHPHQ
jgi:hypothetical protein